MITVDNGRQGHYGIFAVVDDWVEWLVPNDVQVASKVLVFLVESHELSGIHLFGLIERGEFDLFWNQSFVVERSLNGLQIVSADRYKSSLTCKVGMKFILQSYERLVSCFGELDISQNGARY